MCMGCMANGDFLLTSGIVGAASVRVGLRRYLPSLPSRRAKGRGDGTGSLASRAPACSAAPNVLATAPDPTPRPAADMSSGASPDNAATHRVAPSPAVSLAPHHHPRSRGSSIAGRSDDQVLTAR